MSRETARTIMSSKRPLKILRPLTKYLNPLLLRDLDGKIITIFSPLLSWAGALNEGDIIEYGDVDDLQIWFTGQVLYSKIITAKDITPQELSQSLIRFTYRHKDPIQLPTVDELCDLGSQVYKRHFTQQSKTAIIAVRVMKVTIPTYTLRIG